MQCNEKKRSLGECPVCCDNFTKASRKPIECVACQYEACLACSQKYLTTVENAACMQCGHAFNLEYLQAHFPPAWMDGAYKAHRQKVLLESEKVLLPTSQHMVANYRECQGLILQAQTEADERKALLLRIRDLDTNRARLKGRIQWLKESQYNNARAPDAGEGGSSSEAMDSARAAFIMRCPAEECRGYLSSAYKCGICSNYACSKCLTSTGMLRTDPDHECNPADVDTVNLLKKDTKSCPKCNAGIHRLSGCDQMHCVMCRTNFSWKTGQIITRGVLHNPHYFDWLREQSASGEIPRQPGDEQEDPCGDNRLPAARDVNVILETATGNVEIKNAREILQCFREITHVNAVVVQERLRLPPPDEEYRDLRLKFLLGEIDEKKWKSMLATREKRREKIEAFRMAYDVLVRASGDIIRNMISDARTGRTSNVNTTMKSLHELARYVRQALSQVQSRFKCADVPYNIRLPHVYTAIDV